MLYLEKCVFLLHTTIQATTEDYTGEAIRKPVFILYKQEWHVSASAAEERKFLHLLTFLLSLYTCIYVFFFCNYACR